MPTRPRDEGDGSPSSSNEGNDAALLIEGTGLLEGDNVVSVGDSVITEVEPLSIILPDVIGDK